MQKACARYHIDWRFMSSIVWQESHFNSDLLGMGGSFGIMQMMPATAARYGITDTSSVEEQLWAGARYISYLYKIVVDLEPLSKDAYLYWENIKNNSEYNGNLFALHDRGRGILTEGLHEIASGKIFVG